MYVRLAEGMSAEGGHLTDAALDRAAATLRSFRETARAFCGERIVAVGTGVLRQARNREAFLAGLSAETGLQVSVLSGEEEARFTAGGVRWALGIDKSPLVVFDLGGGSTEFVMTGCGRPWMLSIPLGAALLTQGYLRRDPPRETEIDTLRRQIDRQLEPVLRHVPEPRPGLAGTGGTIVTLAAMLERIPVEWISARTINGVIIERSRLGGLFVRMKRMPCANRAQLAGLDEGRAPLVLAGSLVVMRVMDLLGVSALSASLCDLLEGILLDQLKGEKHE